LILAELFSAPRGLLVGPEGKETAQVIKVLLLEKAGIADEGGKALYRKGASRKANEYDFVLPFHEVPVVGQKAVRVSDLGRDA
jgi:hypothetical protein